jgi:hypothetical protein
MSEVSEASRLAALDTARRLRKGEPLGELGAVTIECLLKIIDRQADTIDKIQRMLVERMDKLERGLG